MMVVIFMMSLMALYLPSQATAQEAAKSSTEWNCFDRGISLDTAGTYSWTGMDRQSTPGDANFPFPQNFNSPDEFPLPTFRPLALGDAGSEGSCSSAQATINYNWDLVSGGAVGRDLFNRPVLAGPYDASKCYYIQSSGAPYGVYAEIECGLARSVATQAVTHSQPRCFLQDGNEIDCPTGEIENEDGEPHREAPLEVGRCYVFDDAGWMWGSTNCESAEKGESQYVPRDPEGPSSSEAGSVALPVDARYDCGGVPISIDVECTSGAQNPILAYIGGIANFLAIGVGVILVISMIILGTQYTISQGNPDTVKKAKDRALNIVIAALSYYFMYAILQWLSPSL